ncbi:DUF4445 domain-containing protein [bacterium]|nr:DUF4445 domain-containing protein [bacterium]MBU1881157.1 DUF4445 domain-containing protein [bacterium]
MTKLRENREYTVLLNPDGREIKVQKGQNLRSALASAGIFFPQNCTGKGKCGHCRVLFETELPPVQKREAELLGEHTDYRLACLQHIQSDCEISIPRLQEWRIEKNIRDFDFAGRVSRSFGIAIDLGTTVIAFYLADFSQGIITEQYSVLNPQVHQGGDVMTRLTLARKPEQREALTASVRQGLTDGIKKLLATAQIAVDSISTVSLAGNTTMLHLLLGRDGEGLEIAPFRSPLEGRKKLVLDPAWIGLSARTKCDLFPVLTGFIGGDTTAAIIAADMDLPEGHRLLIDLGTNGEIVLTANGDILATSTAAGPAFEGVGMAAGMPALQGAIEGISDEGDPFVIGGGEPVGYCGSGYISTIAYLHKAGIIDKTGLIRQDHENIRRWTPIPQSRQDLYLTQDDVRKFQLAKAAIAAGIEILCEQAGLDPAQLDEIIVTGSFGNRVTPKSAVAVGLIPDIPIEKITFMDNAAGRGALLCLGNSHFVRRAADLPGKVKVVNLGDHSNFQDIYVANMSF